MATQRGDHHRVRPIHSVPVGAQRQARRRQRPPHPQPHGPAAAKACGRRSAPQHCMCAIVFEVLDGVGGGGVAGHACCGAAHQQTPLENSVEPAAAGLTLITGRICLVNCVEEKKKKRENCVHVQFTFPLPPVPLAQKVAALCCCSCDDYCQSTIGLFSGQYVHVACQCLENGKFQYWVDVSMRTLRVIAALLCIVRVVTSYLFEPIGLFCSGAVCRTA